MHQQIASDLRAAHSEGWRTIRHFVYVDRPFREVRRWLSAAPQLILTDPSRPAEASASTAELRVRRAGFDFGRDVRVVLGEIQIGIHSARLPLRWEDAARPGLFPILDATLEVAPVRAGRHAMTQVGLFGRYRPPFGRFGALADTMAGQRIVLESVERFLDHLVERLNATVPETEPEPGREDSGAAGAGTAEMSDRRRIVLPVDGLDRIPGGAAGLVERLLAEPGVMDASVNPASGLAVVDYDGAACTVRKLLRRAGIED